MGKILLLVVLWLFTWDGIAEAQETRIRENHGLKASDTPSREKAKEKEEADDIQRYCRRGRHFHYEANCKRFGIEAKYCLDERCGYGKCGEFGDNCQNLRRTSGSSGSGASSSSRSEDKKKDSSGSEEHFHGDPGRGPCGKGIFVRAPVEGNPGSRFGYRRDPFTGRQRLHAGLDYPRRTGTPIRASAPGRVVFSGTMGGYGSTIDIEHSRDMSTRYAHMSRRLVSRGQRVTRGQVIGHVGSTGRSTGPHLHFEVLCNGNQVDPEDYINKSVRPPLPKNPPLPVPRPDFEREEYERQWRDVDVGI